MSSGAVVTLLIGIAMLILPAWLTIHLVRRQRRLAAWSRTEATVRHVWKKKNQSSATGTSSTETSIHARYEYRDTADIQHTGEVGHLAKPKVGDIVEIMYDPDDPKASETVNGGSVVGRIINYGFVFLFFGGFAIFLILASLDLISM
ncbi:hypothetical protein BJY24_005548 [Nocardia transvalensis]|uniref:DUF3592 domain-containing protein n=1 Tax=Nocardia transvalensis TaxID=37333 RepID=A0A7W9UKM5_9NOCA|nr:DUF3592 domain-containing protein [Nocardia transvalensis]MBB5916636.1 hypothetical protein [Nocardia transvalensis]